jgi:hypothetical protein
MFPELTLGGRNRTTEGMPLRVNFVQAARLEDELPMWRSPCNMLQKAAASTPSSSPLAPLASTKRQPSYHILVTHPAEKTAWIRITC